MSEKLRSICIYEPDSDELLTLAYFPKDGIPKAADDILAAFGSLEGAGRANFKQFAAVGVFPVTVIYERCGYVVRRQEMPLGGKKKKGSC